MFKYNSNYNLSLFVFLVRTKRAEDTPADFALFPAANDLWIIALATGSRRWQAVGIVELPMFSVVAVARRGLFAARLLHVNYRNEFRHFVYAMGGRDGRE